MQEIDALLSYTEDEDPEEIFELLDILGQGAYGSVSKALHKQTGELYAVKILPTASFQEIAATKKEINILKNCTNPYIVKYYGSYFKDSNLWIVMEYCATGSMTDIINITQKQLHEDEIASVLQAVLKGLAYLHGNKKIHRDIKAANVLLDHYGHAKLADFGVSTESVYTNEGHYTYIGSPYWMSPEIISHSQYNHKTDIWSLGITAIELAEGVVPYFGTKHAIAIFKMRDNPVQGLKHPEKWSAEFNNFITQCLNIDSAKRPEASELLDHAFIEKSKGQSLLYELATNSLHQIEKFRMEENSQYSQNIFPTSQRNSAGGSFVETKTVVSGHKHGINSQSESEANNSMIIQSDGEENQSMVINDGTANEPQKTCLSSYIADMRQTNQVEDEFKSQIEDKMLEIQDKCMVELKKVYEQHKKALQFLVSEGNPSNLKSKLLDSTSLTQFVSEPKAHVQVECARKKQSNSDLQTRMKSFSSSGPISKVAVEGIASFNLSKPSRMKSNDDETTPKGKVPQQGRRYLATQPYEPQDMRRDGHFPLMSKKIQQFIEDPAVLAYLRENQVPEEPVKFNSQTVIMIPHEGTRQPLSQTFSGSFKKQQGSYFSPFEPAQKTEKKDGGSHPKRGNIGKKRGSVNPSSKSKPKVKSSAFRKVKIDSGK